MFKKIMFMLIFAAVSIQSFSQTAQEYKRRYDLLVSRLGPSGVGIESLLEKWERMDSSDLDMLRARYNYYFAKSKSVNIEIKDTKKYLGADPVLTLKDSLGKDVNYFQVTQYDDSLYALAASSLDKAIKLAPSRLDLRMDKAVSLVQYEQESPDMALACLCSLVDETKAGNCAWEYPDVSVTDSLFCQLMQEYCYAFFQMATPSSREAFRTLSVKMLTVYPKNTDFLANVGSYYLVNDDCGQALKYYNKVLKIKPDEYNVIRNCVTLAVKCKSVKLQKKYLPMMIRYGTGADKLSAQARLDALKK